MNNRWHTVKVNDLESSPVHVLVDGVPVEVDLQQIIESPLDATDGVSLETTKRPLHQGRVKGTAKVFNSPMPGMIISVAVGPGDQLITGDEICVLEAMKMQQTLRADWSGIIAKVHVVPGQQVLDGDPIVELN